MQDFFPKIYRTSLAMEEKLPPGVGRAVYPTILEVACYWQDWVMSGFFLSKKESEAWRSR